VQIELEWSRECTKAFGNIKATLMACAEASEHIAMEVIVDEDAKSVKVIPSKKVIVKEEKKEEPKMLPGSDELFGKPPAFPIIYDSITLSFIEFFAFHGDPYWRYEPGNYEGHADEELAERYDGKYKQDSESCAARTWPEGERRHPFFKHPMKTGHDVDPEITRCIYRAIGEKGRTWSSGIKGVDYEERAVGDKGWRPAVGRKYGWGGRNEDKDDEERKNCDNCTWDLKLMELKCHKDIMIPRQMARERSGSRRESSN